MCLPLNMYHFAYGSNKSLTHLIEYAQKYFDSAQNPVDQETQTSLLNTLKNETKLVDAYLFHYELAFKDTGIEGIGGKATILKQENRIVQGKLLMIENSNQHIVELFWKILDQKEGLNREPPIYFKQNVTVFIDHKNQSNDPSKFARGELKNVSAITYIMVNGDDRQYLSPKSYYKNLVLNN